MAYDGLITSFLGQGVVADRPATPNITPEAIAIWYSTDTNELSAYADGAWIENIGGGATLANAATFDTSGGAVAGATFDGSAAKTIDYSTVGAAASSHTHTLDGLSDVNTTGVADGDVLTYDSGTTSWGPAAASGGVETLIERRTIASDSASETFSSLGSYNDLVIRIETRSTSTQTFFQAAANGDTSASNYDYQAGDNVNTTGASFSGTNAGFPIGTVAPSTAPAGFFSPCKMEILNYRGSHHKTSLSQTFLRTGTASTNLRQDFISAVWKSTSAITSLTFVMQTGNIAAGSIIAVYGRS